MKLLASAFLIGSTTICMAQGAPPATGPAPPAGGPPPPYTPVRWNEDYLYLRDPAKRSRSTRSSTSR
jgi:hypothetical protein